MHRFLLNLVIVLWAGHALPVQAVTLKIATIAPEGTSWMQDMRAGAAEVKERTEGRVQLKFYGGGVMGSDRQVLLKMRTGQLHGSVFTPTGLAGIYPDIQIYTLPLLFNNLEEVAYVRERMDQQLLDGLEEAGFVGFGLAGGGFALIMSNEPVTTLADMKAKKVWVPENDHATADSLKSLGLAPVPLQLTDVLTGLQTGLLDIVASPPVAAVVLQWHTKVKYVTDFPVLYTVGFMVVDKRAFSRLTPEDQLVVREVMSRIYENFDTESVEDNAEARDALIATGLSVVTPQNGEVDKWRDQIAATNRELARRGLVQESTLDALLAHLEDFRRGEASGGAP